MMTPQEVANCTFAKAAIGGYHMSSVDEFLDKLTEDYSALYKENAALKAKLKVMVDKMAEYREVEDAMRSTLLTAQKMATSMVSEAEQKRNAMIASASADAQARKNELAKEIENEEHRLVEVRQRVDRELEAERKRLAVGKEKLREFVREMTGICNDHLALLERLPDLSPDEEPQTTRQAPAAPAPKPAIVMNAAPPAPQTAPPAQALEPSPPPSVPAPVKAAMPVKAPEPVKAASDSPVVAAAFVPVDKPAAGRLPQGDPFSDDGASGKQEDLEATRVLNLEDLQFGRNYMRE